MRPPSSQWPGGRPQSKADAAAYVASDAADLAAAKHLRVLPRLIGVAVWKLVRRPQTSDTVTTSAPQPSVRCGLKLAHAVARIFGFIPELSPEVIDGGTGSRAATAVGPLSH
jgi:hypothetical protein